MRIIIETISNKDQRYPTVGDWYYDPDGTLHIKVSEMGHHEMEAAVAVHELVEVLLCRHRGIAQSEVDRFDEEFEAKRQEGDVSEPGDDRNAPYHKEHCFATGIERLLISELDIAWKAYDDTVNSL